MEPLASHTTTDRTNRRQEYELNDPEKGRFGWSRKKTGEKRKDVLGRKPTCKGKNRRHASRDEEGEKAREAGT
jgi:hypothetical protein